MPVVALWHHSDVAPPPSCLPSDSFQLMVAEKQRAEAAARAAEATVTATPEGPAPSGEQVAGQGVEPQPAEDGGQPPASEPELKPHDKSPATTGPCRPEEEPSAPEKTPSPHPSTAPAAEAHERVPSSREKRESRRQRGLEHVELQNKHSQACREESALREPSGRAAPEPQQNLEVDRQEKADKTPTATGTNTEAPERPPEPPQATADNRVSGDTVKVPPGGSPRPGHAERPTSLALDSQLCSPTPKDKDRPSGSPQAHSKPESPGGSSQIQRYRDPDTERLANAVELWRGKKLVPASPSSMLSQSLDLSERQRPVGAVLTPAE